jgi:hypothetical protein
VLTFSTFPSEISFDPVTSYLQDTHRKTCRFSCKVTLTFSCFNRNGNVMIFSQSPHTKISLQSFKTFWSFPTLVNNYMDKVILKLVHWSSKAQKNAFLLWGRQKMFADFHTSSCWQRCGNALRVPMEGICQIYWTAVTSVSEKCASVCRRNCVYFTSSYSSGVALPTNRQHKMVRKNHPELLEERGKRTNMNKILALYSVILRNSSHGFGFEGASYFTLQTRRSSPPFVCSG